ncbi:MAG: 50S ribosomal protein L22 [Parcubacteria group bacterium]|nr:50S ribosomal protein L22 [Parcubacteria group bacterium]MBI2175583.1 50S ribosomal protein L22 [Parcubacteria group bacterium]
MREAKAHLRYLSIAPRKVRLVADVIRGKEVEDARNTLRFMLKRAAAPFNTLLSSAVANAAHNAMDKEKLVVKIVRVDKGPILKRYLPRARGRATPLRRRRSHVTIVLGEREEADVTNKKQSKQRRDSQ